MIHECNKYLCVMYPTLQFRHRFKIDDTFIMLWYVTHFWQFVDSDAPNPWLKWLHTQCVIGIIIWKWLLWMILTPYWFWNKLHKIKEMTSIQKTNKNIKRFTQGRCKLGFINLTDYEWDFYSARIHVALCIGISKPNK